MEAHCKRYHLFRIGTIQIEVTVLCEEVTKAAEEEGQKNNNFWIWHILL